MDIDISCGYLVIWGWSKSCTYFYNRRAKGLSGMPLRLMEITIPEEDDLDVVGLLEEHKPAGVWRSATHDGKVLVHMVIRAEQAEPIMDELEQRYSGRDDFRVVLLPVEAVLPRPEEPEADGSGGAGKAEDDKCYGWRRVSREELYTDVLDSIRITRPFVVLVLLSAVVAAVGLIRDNTAVIIGAMVIAPLLGPNVGLALGTTLADPELTAKALRTISLGVCMVLGVALLIGHVFDFDANVDAIIIRTDVGFSDIALALAAGVAAAFAFTSGLVRAVIGVMVAVALLPPLVSFGLLLGAGKYSLASGAILLTGVNLICINLAGVGAFLMEGVRPRSWWEAKRAARSSRIAAILWTSLLGLLVILLMLR